MLLKMRNKSVLASIASCLWFMILPLHATQLQAEIGKAGDNKPVNTIIYRKIKWSRAYAMPSSENHLNIKITTPKTLGPKSFVLVEMYNNTKSNIAVVDFDLILNNYGVYDMSSHVNCTDMLPGRSALRLVAAKGKGDFPEIKDFKIEHLQIFNDKAIKVVVHTFADLVIPNSSK